MLAALSGALLALLPGACCALYFPARPHPARRFNAIDTDRTGSITAAELQRAMALGNLHFSLMACAQVGGLTRAGLPALQDAPAFPMG